jgi:hypothetical protein
MAQWIRAVYSPPEKGMPFLAVIISGVRSKKIEFAALTKSREEAEAALEQAWPDAICKDPIAQARRKLEARYLTKQNDAPRS